MNSKRLAITLFGLIGLTILGMIGGAYGINSMLSSRSTKLVSLKAQSQALDQEQLSLVKAKKDIKTYSSLEQITQTVVPQDKDQAEAVREIVNIASANNVSLGSITFPTSTLGSSTSSIGSASPSSSAPPVINSNANSKSNQLSQLQIVKNIPGVYQLAITVQSDANNPVPYNQFINFLSGLEHNRRTSQVSSITLTPDSKNPNDLSFSLILEDYIKP